MRTSLTILGALVGALLLPARVEASQAYLEFLAAPEASMPGAAFVYQGAWLGQCELCHASKAGGDATVTPFVASLKATGNTLGAGQLDPLRAALAQLSAAGTDSDGDGVADVEELNLGSDPNDKSCSTAGCYSPYLGPESEFGCTGRIAGASVPESQRGVATFAALALAMGLGLCRRRRLGRG